MMAFKRSRDYYRTVRDVVRSLLTLGAWNQARSWSDDPSRDIVIWNFQDGGCYEVITGVLRSGSTIGLLTYMRYTNGRIVHFTFLYFIREDYLFRQELSEKKHFENEDRQRDRQTEWQTHMQDTAT